LNSLINDTLEILKPQKQFKHVEIAFESHKRPACVSGDEGQLQQVLVNLLLNAAQAMQSEGHILIFLEGVTFRPQVTFKDSTKKYKTVRS
jgi:signal transduction histidine kinase